MIRFLSVVFFTILMQLTRAQGVDALFRSNQKFYVVVAVLLIIFVGIIFFLFRVEKRLKRLEK